MAEYLRDEEMEAFAAFLRAHYQVVRHVDAVLARETRLTLSAFEVLRWVERAGPRGLRMSELADLVLLSRSGITRLVDQLVERGILERVRCPTDQRGWLAMLTDEGRRVLEETAVVHFEEIRKSFTGRLTDDELRALTAILGRIGEEAPNIFEDAEGA